MDLLDRFRDIFFGRWFVVLFFGAQGYWQVTGLLGNRTAGRVIETVCWLALGVLLAFVAWKIGWGNLSALGTEAQKRRRRVAVLASVPLSIAGIQLLVTDDAYLWAIGTLFMLVPVVGLLYLIFRWYTRDRGVPQPFAPPAPSD